jgi:hypothetical protein
MLQMAQAAGGHWVAMPCCIRGGLFTDAQVSLSGEDDRYALMCGILAATFRAKRVTSIDRRITNRHIMLMG